MTTGVFIRELSQSIHGTPRQAAERAASAAVDFVVFAILWQDRGRRQRFMNERSLLDYALVMRDVGVDVWLWSYPWVEMEELCVRTFRRRTDELGGAVSGWIIDPELGYKWDHEHPEGVVRRGAQSLMEGLVDAADESIDIGVTSYGAIHLPCHSNFPWDVFTAYGIQIPQIYNMARSMVKRCLDGWRAAAGESSVIIPAVQAYGDHDEEELAPWLEMVHEVAPWLAGQIFWSWRQISKREWKTIAAFAGR